MIMIKIKRMRPIKTDTVINIRLLIKKYSVILIVLAIIIISSTSVNAGIFSVGVDICTPQWQCTAFDRDDCGTRECIDINTCGINLGKPGEFIECKNISSTKGSGGSYDKTPEIIMPEFKLSSDIIKIELKPGEKSKRTISISSEKKYSYTLSVSGSNTQFSDNVRLSKEALEGNGEFDILVTAGEND